MNQLIGKTRRFFNTRQYYARGHIFLDKVVLAHISKSLSVAQGVMCLIDAGLAEEAFGLSRTMVEIALNLRFITNRYSERRAKRFVHYFARWKMELIRRTLKHYNASAKEQGVTVTYTKPQLRKMMKDYKQLLKIARKYPNRTSWTETKNKKASKGGVWRMAMEPDRYETLQGAPFKWEFDYDWIYFWTSQYVHVSAIALDSHVVLPLEPFEMNPAPCRGKHTAALAVFNVGIYLHKILFIGFRAIGHEYPETLHEPLGKLLHEMAKA